MPLSDITPPLPYTFRDGAVLVTLAAVVENPGMVSVLLMTSMFDVLVPIELPLHLVGCPTDDWSVVEANISMTVRALA